MIGSIVREAAQRERPVVAFGEMVALLWEAGDVAGAIELEKLCNELCARVETFSLVCGYRSASGLATRRTARGARAGVPSCTPPCSTRRSPLSMSYSARFDPVLSGAELRRTASPPDRDRVSGGRTRAAPGCQLVISELATNAVRHARTRVLGHGSARARSASRSPFEDSSGEQPIVREPGPEALSGRGLRLIGEIAEAWGIEWTAAGKTVWARLLI